MSNVGEVPSLHRDPRFPKPPAFGVGSPQHDEEVRQYQAQKALALINSGGEQITPPQPVAEKPPVDLSQLPPPDPNKRLG